MTFKDLRYEIAVLCQPDGERPARVYANHNDLMEVQIDLASRIDEDVTPAAQVKYEAKSTQQRPGGWIMTVDGVDVHRDGTLPRGSIRADYT